MKRTSQEYHLVLPEKHKPSVSEMIVVFTIASIIGFLIETGYVFLSVGKVVKRGMLLGPYCPIYGFGALILYLCFYNVKAKKVNIPLIFISASLILGSFELICGLIFKYIFNIEMWNYSDKPLNILNYTTLPILIGWGILGTIYVFFLHPIILKLVRHISPILLKKVAITICAIFILDFIISTKRIWINPNILNNLVNPENASIEINFQKEKEDFKSSLFFVPIHLNY